METTMSDSEIKDSGIKVLSIPLSEIHADDNFNCRGEIAPIEVVDLAKDIEIRGLIQPVVVTPYDDQKQKETGYKYLLVAGYMRRMAHVVLKKKTIQALVRQDIGDEAEIRFFNLAENLQRKDLNIMQEARALNKLKSLGITREETARRIGKSPGWVQIRYMFLGLPEEIQQEIAAGLITQGQIREIFTIFNTVGKEEAFNAVKKLKDAKIKGRSITVNPHAKKKDSKKHRTRGEIFEMMEHIQETVGNGLYTRCLAWAAGEITNEDLFISCDEHAETQGKVFVRPA